MLWYFLGKLLPVLILPVLRPDAPAPVVVKNESPQESQRFSENLGTLNLSLLCQGKNHCHLEFAISERSDLRFRSAIFQHFFCEACGKGLQFKI